MPDYGTFPRRILIVDDEATLIFFLQQSLQESGHNFIIDVAHCGDDALGKLTSTTYDLLITDLKMPDITGFTLVEVARSLQPNIKVILMTAFGSYDVQTEVKELSVDGYLTKPFPTAQLRDLTENLFATSNNSLLAHPG